MAEQNQEQQNRGEQERGLVSHIGPIEIDWPRSIGYYGGIGLAVAFELIEPPLAIFIAAVPFFKMLNHPKSSRPTRFVAQLLDGAAKPVGGSAEATVQLESKQAPSPKRLSILQEARQIADKAQADKQHKAISDQPTG
jgi:hypothetical protein